jgi:hypothetical protein
MPQLGRCKRIWQHSTPGSDDRQLTKGNLNFLLTRWNHAVKLNLVQLTIKAEGTSNEERS